MNKIVQCKSSFILETDDGRVISDLGQSIIVMLRGITEHRPKNSGFLYGFNYFVEIKESLIHSREPVSSNNLATLPLPTVGTAITTAKYVFDEAAWGREHRLTREKRVLSGFPDFYGLAINGLYQTDEGIQHVGGPSK